MPTKQRQTSPGLAMDTNRFSELRFLTIYNKGPFKSADPFEDLEFSHFVYTSTSEAGYTLLAQELEATEARLSLMTKYLGMLLHPSGNDVFEQGPPDLRDDLRKGIRIIYKKTPLTWQELLASARKGRQIIGISYGPDGPKFTKS